MQKQKNPCTLYWLSHIQNHKTLFFSVTAMPTYIYTFCNLLLDSVLPLTNVANLCLPLINNCSISQQHAVSTECTFIYYLHWMYHCCPVNLNAFLQENSTAVTHDFTVSTLKSLKTNVFVSAAFHFPLENHSVSFLVYQVHNHREFLTLLL